MKKIIFLSFCLLLFISSGFAQPAKVILDTDLDSDVDDVGALAMLHTLADHNKVDILGVVVTSNDEHAPQCADAINHYFKRPDIPIGVEKGIKLQSISKYTRKVSEEFPHSLKSYNQAEDAVSLYRKLLASQPDNSIIIITIGHLTNLRRLLESKPDQFSSLSGRDLIKKKVKLWSCMGGAFPEGKEANFYRPDAASTKICVENWPGKVVFAGWEVGNIIITGGAYLKKTLTKENPVWKAYHYYNDFQGRQSWDQAAVLYAISQEDDYWNLNRNGYCKIAEDGSNFWVEGKNTNHAYLVEKMDPKEVAKVIDALMTGIYYDQF